MMLSFHKLASSLRSWHLGLLSNQKWQTIVTVAWYPLKSGAFPRLYYFKGILWLHCLFFRIPLGPIVGTNAHHPLWSAHSLHSNHTWHFWTLGEFFLVYKKLSHVAPKNTYVCRIKSSCNGILYWGKLHLLNLHSENHWYEWDTSCKWLSAKVHSQQLGDGCEGKLQLEETALV